MDKYSLYIPICITDLDNISRRFFFSCKQENIEQDLANFPAVEIAKGDSYGVIRVDLLVLVVLSCRHVVNSRVVFKRFDGQF